MSYYICNPLSCEHVVLPHKFDPVLGIYQSFSTLSRMMLSLLRATRLHQLQVGRRGLGSAVQGFTESVGNTPLVRVTVGASVGAL